MGVTLTLPAFYTYFVISAVTMLVDVIGAQIWKILIFCIHRFRSTSEPSDGLHFQTQAALRNKYTGGSTLWRLIRLTWAWRKKTDGAFRRTLPLIIIAAIHLIFFVALGLLASQITETNSKVRVKSDVCGWVDQSILASTSEATIDWSDADAIAVSGLSLYRKSAAYVSQCYASNETQKQVCQAMIQDRLSSKIDKEAACPFVEGTCSTKAYSLDSGLIDASSHLGMNIPIDANIQLRKVTTCAPLLIEEKYSTPFQAARRSPAPFSPAPLPGDTYKYYSFGKAKSLGVAVADWTLEIQNYSVVTGSTPYELLLVHQLAHTLVDANFLSIVQDQVLPIMVCLCL